MPESEHRIRLRGAWDRVDEPTEPPRRVDLPTRWDPLDGCRPFTLRRMFGRPAVEPSRQAVTLELVDVPGLLAVRLNGAPLVGSGGLAGPIRVDVGGRLLPRNVLELDVATITPAGAADGATWGAIALVIAERLDE